MFYRKSAVEYLFGGTGVHLKLTVEQRLFLASVRGFNERFNAVRKGRTWVPLCHSFWSNAEIKRAGKIQDEWNVPKSLVPFYGDWHTLICLDPKLGAVKLLDDERNILFAWKSITVFVRSLAMRREKPLDTSEIIESEWFDF